jgi:hypothetical protein
MGRRGPQARGEYKDKSAVLSTKISAELRTQLERAARASGSTLSREIEHRLRRTFGDAAASAAQFGGERNYRLMQLVGIAMTLRRQPKADWLADPDLFVEVLRVIHHLLWQIRPPGTEQRFTVPGADDAQATAEAIWAMIHSADETLPLGASASQHRADLIKADLGEIVDRPTYELTNYIPPPPSPPSKRAARRKK